MKNRLQDHDLKGQETLMGLFLKPNKLNLEAEPTYLAYTQGCLA